MRDDDPELPPVFTRAEALGAGLSRHQIAHRVRTGRWVALRRCVYALTNLYDALPHRERHTLLVIASLLTRPDDDIASHLSAAVIHHCVLPLGEVERVSLTSGDLDRPTHGTPRLVLQVASLPSWDRTLQRVSVRGHSWSVRVTSPARTVADNLRHLAHPDGVALADAAIRSGLVGWEQMARVLERQGAWPYGQHGLSALPLIDPRRESWLESHSFIKLHERGMPLPEPQVQISDRRGRVLGRVDGWIEDSAVALEADGLEKYQMVPDGDPDAAADDLQGRVMGRLREEKRREDRIRDLGAEFARWGTHEIVGDTEAVLRRIDDARARGDVSRFTGRTTYLPTPPWFGRALKPPA